MRTPLRHWSGLSERAAISTDPPYYDNVGYADLSDFFYVWLRRARSAPGTRSVYDGA